MRNLKLPAYIQHMTFRSVEIAIFFARFSPEFPAPSFSLFARAIEQAQAVFVLHQLPSVDSEKDKHHKCVNGTVCITLRIVKLEMVTIL